MPPDKRSDRRLITVSNRLPIVVTRAEDGQWRAEPGSGGLITALAPVFRDRGGVWVGWTGTVEEEEVDLDRLLAGAMQSSCWPTTAPPRSR